MILRKLNENDRKSLEALVNEIESGLTVKEWWLPISDRTRKNYFNNETTCFMGFEEEGRIIAACGLFYDESEYNEEIEAIGIKESSKKIAEIGRCMVLSGYRGQNLMVKVNEALIKEAENNGIDILVATAHPDNIPSNKSFEKLGFKKCCTKTLWGDYLRNIYIFQRI